MTNKSSIPLVDHLFRHQYGKMVSILTRIFGLTHIEIIEDAVQDTFLKASIQWREGYPENPEAWLTRAAKNRVIDLFREINARKKRESMIPHGSISLEISEYFLDHEVKDSQLRMIFVACHPAFSREEQIAFALKTISGFSLKEIAAALLQNEETVKKRLTRARKKIKTSAISLNFPVPSEIPDRMGGVMQVIYLIFNEGFHSTRPEQLINKELCGEALRLCSMLLKKKEFRSGTLYALFALLCFHASRIDSKVLNNEIIDLKTQDRKTWYQPLIELGCNALLKMETYPDQSGYHFEALIAAEHVKARSFGETDWETILTTYELWYAHSPNIQIILTRAIIFLQTGRVEKAETLLERIEPKELHQRKYLYYGTIAELNVKKSKLRQASEALDLAIRYCRNDMERQYLLSKRQTLSKDEGYLPTEIEEGGSAPSP